MAKDPSLLLSSSPHITSPVKTQELMGRVLLALTPAAAFGIFLYGIPALLTMLVSMAAAVLAESLFRLVTKRDIRAGDLSAVVTGLLLALVLPPAAPLWITALGAVFAVVVAKEFFGGLGANVFNPALSGRAFLIMSFPAALTTWSRPLISSPEVLADSVTGATPLYFIKAGEGIAAAGADLAASGLASSADYWSLIRTLFFGFRGGCIGESSILLILAGGFFLLITKTIDWRAPAALIAATALASFVLGQDPLFAVLSGGVVFGAIFMATDYVSAPVTAKGKLIFGFGAGLITVLIRKWGNFPEGCTYGILIMNAVTPFLNRLLQKKYGFIPKKTPQGAAK
ncbi:electron transport complex subunit D [Spirochaetia bacterium]|nr:electron transport complex subunit D [Spirochaetia bacterium]